MLDVLIPTCERPAALTVTLAGLLNQSRRDFRVVVSDQTEAYDATAMPEVAAVVRVLDTLGIEVSRRRHLPRRGMAEQRQFLMEQSQAPYVLFMDDDVILEGDVVARMLHAIEEERCRFVGCAVIGLSYRDEVREQERTIEFWDGARDAGVG